MLSITVVTSIKVFVSSIKAVPFHTRSLFAGFVKSLILFSPHFLASLLIVFLQIFFCQ